LAQSFQFISALFNLIPEKHQ